MNCVPNFKTEEVIEVGQCDVWLTFDDPPPALAFKDWWAEEGVILFQAWVVQNNGNINPKTAVAWNNRK